jgi:hypothetical protein
MPETTFPDALPKIGQKIVVRAEVFDSALREKEVFVTDIKKERPKKGDEGKEVFFVFVEGKDSPSLIFSNGVWTLIQEIPCQVDILEEHKHVA